MPYLTTERKQELLAGATLETPGDLTWALTVAALELDYEAWDDEFTTIIDDYLDQLRGDPVRYADYAVILGCLSSTKREFYRRTGSRDAWEYIEAYEQAYYRNHVAPYEDKKIEQNGDVF